MTIYLVIFKQKKTLDLNIHGNEALRKPTPNKCSQRLSDWRLHPGGIEIFEGFVTSC